jgi:hypothetical protein
MHGDGLYNLPFDLTLASNSLFLEALPDLAVWIACQQYLVTAIKVMAALGLLALQCC